ncbi:MAG: polyhydroxyalkanoate depolymerase [Verrucomicrobia bacterium]|nr:MAG: polyhydroxyalkanoate depolymerase [Verrucomicrobiota bacterium]
MTRRAAARTLLRMRWFVLFGIATARLAWAGLDPARVSAAGDNAPVLLAFAEAAAKDFGDPGAKAAAFLVAGMPDGDLRSLSQDFLMKNLRLALQTRDEYPWSKQVPEALFLDWVLPYAQLDEPRDAWRANLHAQCTTIVKDCHTATAAVLAINRTLFKQLGVKYSTRRQRPNQSPQESIAQGLASCTGLSIILADACRSIGIPARVAGTALWANKSGNHTWVEIWDGDWHCAGAGEPSSDGLDHGWFIGNASQAIAEDPTYAIWANRWAPAKASFPLVWNPADHSVPAVNVTARYTSGTHNKATDADKNPAAATLHLRVLEDAGLRVVARVELLDQAGQFIHAVTTQAGNSDLNDMPTLDAQPATAFTLRVLRDGQARDFPQTAAAAGDTVLDLTWSKGRPAAATPGLLALRKWLCQPAAAALPAIPPASLTKNEAVAAGALVWDQWRTHMAATRSAEWHDQVITIGDKSMRLLTRVFGAPPADGRSLWISMHGGGGAPAEVNDQQWQNQIRLYQPAEGIYLAPRAPTDHWNLWHEGHIDELFDRLIEDAVLLAGVNPDKIYLMGYSAGGDGVYQLAPRLADRLAAASMMAGHPGNASPLGLRNLPFAIFAGGEDAAFKRNKIAAEWGAKLDALEQQEPGAYVHCVNVYPGLPHWMNGKDAEALPWMAKFTRNPWPKNIAWCQSDRVHDRFYWLVLPEGVAAAGLTIHASAENNVITLDAPGVTQLTLRLHDRLVDLDRALKVRLNGKTVFEGKVTRQADAILKSLQQRADPHSAATALLEIHG